VSQIQRVGRIDGRVSILGLIGLANFVKYFIESIFVTLAYSFSTNIFYIPELFAVKAEQPLLVMNQSICWGSKIYLLPAISAVSTIQNSQVNSSDKSYAGCDLLRDKRAIIR